MSLRTQRLPAVVALMLAVLCFSWAPVATGDPPAMAGGIGLEPPPFYLSTFGGNGTGAGQFAYSALSVAVHSSGTVLVADSFQERVQSFDSNGNFVRMWGWGVATGAAAFEICTSGCQAGITGAGDGQFYTLNGIGVDAAGNVYVSDSNNNRIQKFDANGNLLLMWGWGVATGASAFETCTSGCQAGINGNGDGQFAGPWGIALDGSANAYVADRYNNRVQMFDSSGNFVLKWGSNGLGDGQFAAPYYIAVDAAGSNVVVTDPDTNQNRVQRFELADPCPAGTTQIVPGVCFAVKWGSLGTGDGEFVGPSGVALDAAGDVYVADMNPQNFDSNSRIQKFDDDGNFLAKWGEYCSLNQEPDCFGGFWKPYDLGVDGAGNVYVLETNNNRVQKFGRPMTGMCVLDAFGGVHVGGTAPVMSPPTPYFGFSVAVDVELGVTGLHVLDAFGGVHVGGGVSPMGTATPYFGFDIARDLELASTGYHVLDGYGGVHAGGGATSLSPAPPYFGFDVAIDLELANTGAYVLDEFGGLHAAGGASPLSPATPYFGFRIASDFELAPTGFYVLDGFGGVHAGGGAPVMSPGTPYFGFDAAMDLELAAAGFYVLDALGGVYNGGGAPVLTPATPNFGFDVAVDLELR